MNGPPEDETPEPPKAEEKSKESTPNDPTPEDPTPPDVVSERRALADLNGDGKVDDLDIAVWLMGRALWKVLTPPGVPNPPGYGDDGPGSNDPVYRDPYDDIA